MNGFGSPCRRVSLMLVGLTAAGVVVGTPRTTPIGCATTSELAALSVAGQEDDCYYFSERLPEGVEIEGCYQCTEDKDVDWKLFQRLRPLHALMLERDQFVRLEGDQRLVLGALVAVDETAGPGSVGDLGEGG